MCKRQFLDIDKAFSVLSELQKEYVFIPFDKCDNNISIVCKRLYLSCIQHELEKSFKSCDKNAEDIDNGQKNKLKDDTILLDES